MDLQSKLYFYDNDNKWTELWEGIERKIIGYDKNLMMVKVRFEKGKSAPPHNHPHSQSSFIASGKFEVQVGDLTEVLSEGDGFFVPSEVVHSVTALEEGIIIDSFSPAREDFLKRK